MNWREETPIEEIIYWLRELDALHSYSITKTRDLISVRTEMDEYILRDTYYNLNETHIPKLKVILAEGNLNEVRTIMKENTLFIDIKLT